MQAGNQAISSLGAVLKEEGAKGLWRGNGLAVGRAMVQKGIVFGTQDQLRTALNSDMAAGACAGLAAGALTSDRILARYHVLFVCLMLQGRHNLPT